MANGIDRGGLDYNINVGGDFETQFAKFNSLVKQVDAAATTSARKVATKQDKAGANAVQAEAKARDRVTVALNKQNAVERKIAQLKDRQKVALSGRVKDQKVITDAVEREFKAEVAKDKIKLKSAKTAISQAKAEERIARVMLKQLEIQKAIRIARQAGPVGPAQVSKVTGLSSAELGRNDKAIAAQNLNIKEQEILRKRNLALQKKQVKEAEKLRRQEEKLVKTTKSRTLEEKKAARELVKTTKSARQLGDALKRTDDFAANFLFTFRRLVGILAIFTLARRFASLIGNAVGEMARFNSVLEQSRISFATLVAAAGDMVTINGELVNGTDEYVKSLGVAKEIQKRIRIDALGTVATFEDLLGAFQAGIGPGLAAGLDLEEIETVTVAMVKAASTLGVQGAQFTEEIRSIIQGTGQLRTTRLLQIPGLSKESIKLAKEQGRLFDQITQALGPFNDATDDVVKSWAGLQSQIKDAISSLLASGSVEYFDTLKDSMQGFVNALIDRDEILKGNFGLNEDAVQAVEEVSGALTGVIDDFKQLVTFDELFGSLRLNFAAVGESLKLASDLISPIIVGIARGVTLMGSLVAITLKFARALANALPKPLLTGFKEILAIISTVIGLSVTWALLSKVVSAAYIGIQAVLGSIAVIKTTIIALSTIWNLALINIANKMGVIQAFSLAIAATVSLSALIIGAIAVVVGIILVKTGALSKLFSKINNSLDGTKDSLKDILKDVLGGTNAILGQSDAVKELRAGFAATEDAVEKLQNRIKAGLLTAAIRGEARPIFTAFSDGFAKANDKVIKARRDLELINKQIDREQETRDNEAVDRAVRTAFEIRAAQALAAEGFGPETGADAEASFARDLTRSTQMLLEEEAKYQALIVRRRELEQVIADTLDDQVKSINEQVALARDALDRQQDGVKNINDSFELRKTLIEEEVRNARHLVAEYALQRVEVEKQQALFENNERLRSESISAIDDTIAKAKELKLEDEAINDLERSKTQTIENNNLARDNELATIRSMNTELQELANIVVENDWLEAMSNGFKQGALEFIEQADTLAEGFAEAMTSALEDFVDRSADALTDLFDPRIEEKEDPGVIAGEVLLGVVNDLVNTILQNFIANLLSGFLVQNVSQTANTTALTVNTATMGGLIVALAANTTAVAINTAVPGTKGGYVTSGGGLARGFMNGGMVDFAKLIPTVKGYASGGGVGHPRPSHISPVDTVPAWLQPGEFIIPKMRVAQYGKQFFEMIRRGSITPDMGRRFLESRMARTKGVYGMAHGGEVPGASVAVSRQETEGGAGTPIVQPVIVADEDTMDQLMAGGLDTFQSGVNDTPDTGNQNVSNA